MWFQKLVKFFLGKKLIELTNTEKGDKINGYST